MSAPRLAVAAGSELGAAAAAEVARAGGNAIDACLASSVMAWVAEPFFASVAGSGFVSVGTPDGVVEVFDGNSIMPFTAPEPRGQGIERVYLEYSNGMYTGIGGGSIAVPGILAAVRRAWERHGHIDWAALFEPAIRAARDGIPFPRTSDYYLSCTWNEIWSAYPAANELFGVDDRPMRVGERFVQPALAGSLGLIAAKGPEVFYDGELADAIVDAIADEDGFIAREDLKAYTVEVRAPVPTEVFGWSVESNPPPAVGGAVLTHMLALLQDANLIDPVARLRAVIEAEQAAVGYRHERYGDPGHIAGGLAEALERAAAKRSPETTHSSAADADGYVCAVTESNGYGAGLVVNGILLNNTLGEEELNPSGAHGLPPGSRCHSNMAPTIARGPDLTVALGSPGADRIVSAIAQTFLAIAVDGLPLADAVGAPRAHVASRPQGLLLCYEPGLPADELNDPTYVLRPYDDLHMFFGGVQAASADATGAVDAAFDPRRSGGCALV